MIVVNSLYFEDSFILIYVK